ncbi:unnamed protein product [Echinostoma caproni]|uniref:BAH domain-containing protein n=1 Tax=Echinostoma caproni TaxID=27848 RepID=A0A183B905_9TREM|nr:unnamed protein product [Echinostoma caproni]
MLSMFSRKQKTKCRKNTSETGHIEILDGSMEMRDSHPPQFLKNGKSTKSRTTTHRSGRGKIRASSASPQPVSSVRRIPGISVTFESTLPTQVWQASPSPSPPLLLDGQSKLLNQRMVSSLSDNWAEKPRGSARQTSERRLRGRGDSKSFQSWLADMDADDSSDETNHSGQSNGSLSSCSSSDESLTGPERPGECKTSSSTTTVTTDSTSSLDLRMVSNSDGNLVQSVANAMTRRYSVGQQHQNRKKDRSNLSNRKCLSEKKRRNLPVHAVSSSSSSSEEDLEALGWDERTISALTSRNKTRQATALRQSTTAQNLSGKFQKHSKDFPPVNNSTTKSSNSWSNQNANVCMPLQPLAPLRVDYEQVYVGTTVNHPQSCVLSRRAHKLSNEEQVDYINRPTNNRAIANENPFAYNIGPMAGQGSDLLAAITADYKPLPEWEQQYKVIPVRKGDYVCVLSRPMKSRTSSEAVTTKRSTKERNGQNSGSANANAADDDANTWLYVRRWCVDHLVATGPPGFVPRNHCRLLPSSELLRLWHQNQTTRNNRMHTSVPSASSASADPDVNNTLHSCTRSLAEHDYLQSNCARVHNTSMDFPSPSTTSSISAQNRFPYGSYRPDIPRYPFAYPTSSLCANHPQIPPPPPGFGSGGSLGSETEDRDSGRGPSSGSEWGSGRGGSSSVTLDQSAVEKTASDTGIERRTVPNTERSRNVKSAEESQLGWYAPDGSVWSSEPSSSNRDDGIYSHDSALQSPNDSDLTPQLLNRTLVNYALSSGEHQVIGQPVPASPLMLTTRTSCTPVLEMRPAGTPTLFARGLPVNVIHPTDSLITSTTTCATVIETKLVADTDNSTVEQRTETPDPNCWEPYQTVIHVNENSLEKFTLV